MMLVEMYTRKDVTDAEKARSSISVHFRNVSTFDFEFTFLFIHPSNKNLEKSNGNDKPPRHIPGMNRGDEIKIGRTRFPRMGKGRGERGNSLLHVTQQTRLFWAIIAHAAITCQSLRNKNQSDERILSMR